MRFISTAFCATIFILAFVLLVPVESRTSGLLGSNQCTWGPSFWCSNITNAKGCHAVRHCIQTVWEQQTVPEDNDSICQICLDMVKQARDQLESNETQSDIKAVLEGSCKLIPIKSVRKECIKLADDFVPELVETLASQMNPQVVCSVAGLCNNAAIDKMLAELAAATTTTTTTTTITSTPEPKPYSPASTGVPIVDKEFTCSGCNNIATIITNKFHSSSRDDVLENMLHVCGRFSSFSDACSNIVLTYFNDIYDELQKSITAESICHLSGVCADKYHQHPELVEIRPMSNVGVIPVKDDIPCELCEQLVRHLRDLLITNTTEDEFKTVLEGLCKQTKEFKDECLSLVDQYYDEIYRTLVENLDENGICFLIGICPKDLNDGKDIETRPIMPLLPQFPPQRIEVTIKELPKKKMLGENEPSFTNEEIQSMQLPIDKLLGPPHPDTLIQNGQLCTLCEYFLHFVQEALATPSNEEEIKQVVSKVCDKMPVSIRGQCHNFLDTYGDAIIALLIQEIDPTQICPMLNICPQKVEDTEVFAPNTIAVSINSKPSNADKPTCPLCLLAIQEAQEVIKKDKTIENIRHALDNLCIHLPKNMKDECVDFIDTYSAELIQLLINDFTPQEICVYIKLCSKDKPNLDELHIKIESEEDFMTNEIPDDTINGQPIKMMHKEFISSPECGFCVRVIKDVEKRVVNKKSREQIKHALEHACDKLGKYKRKCHTYVEKHGDQIIDLIMKDLSPKQICHALGYCSWQETDDLDIDEALKIDVIAIPSDHSNTKLAEIGFDIPIPTTTTTGKGDILPECILCEFIISKLENQLQKNATKEEIKHILKNICSIMPKTVKANCNKFIVDYGELILDVLNTVSTKEVCQLIALCPFALQKITDEVIECGVCHGTVTGLIPLIKSSDQALEHMELIETGCDNLPAKYFEDCSELINYYGESIINLVRFGTDESEICAQIGKCFKKERSSWAYMSLNNEDDNLKRIRRSASKKELLGSKRCSWGPSYWCESRENADECHATQYCVDKAWGKEVSSNSI